MLAHVRDEFGPIRGNDAHYLFIFRQPRDISVVGRGDRQASMRSRNTVDANLPCVGSAAIPHAVASALLSATSALGLGRMRSSAGAPTGLELDLWIVAKPLAHLRPRRTTNAIIRCRSRRRTGAGVDGSARR